MVWFEGVRGRKAAGRRARRARRGYTLVETLVAVMLVSVVVTSVFSMVLTAKIGTKKTGRRAEAMYYARQYMEMLKAYVTADTTAVGPTAGWVLPGDPCGCYALQNGVHTMTTNLPASFTAPPVNGQLSYTVSDVPCGAFTCKSVSFNVSWQSD